MFSEKKSRSYTFSQFSGHTSVKMNPFEVFTSLTSSDILASLLLVSFFLATHYLFCRWILLPKPILGIPYNGEAAKRLLGDMPALRSDPEGVAQWCSKQLSKLETPICQALMGPDSLQKPLVLVADVEEVRDVLLGRSDFDRSSYISNRLPLCMYPTFSFDAILQIQESSGAGF